MIFYKLFRMMSIQVYKPNFKPQVYLSNSWLYLYFRVVKFLKSNSKFDLQIKRIFPENYHCAIASGQQAVSRQAWCLLRPFRPGMRLAEAVLERASSMTMTIVSVEASCDWVSALSATTALTPHHNILKPFLKQHSWFLWLGIYIICPCDELNFN